MTGDIFFSFLDLRNEELRIENFGDDKEKVKQKPNIWKQFQCFWEQSRKRKRNKEWVTNDREKEKREEVEYKGDRNRAYLEMVLQTIGHWTNVVCVGTYRKSQIVKQTNTQTDGQRDKRKRQTVQLVVCLPKFNSLELKMRKEEEEKKRKNTEKYRKNDIPR